MSRDLFDFGQLQELIEIQKVRLRKTGRGIRLEVQGLIDRLTSGGVAPLGDIRTTQAKTLWDHGWGKELGISSFAQYLETIPPVPERPAGMPDCFQPVLWDLRSLFREEGKTPRVSLVKVCRLLCVRFHGADDTFVQHEATPEVTDPIRWVWCQGGRKNLGKSTEDCRKSFAPSEVGLEAIGGLFLYAQDPSVIGGDGDARHFMILPGSVRRGIRERCACLEHWGDGVKLYWNWGDDVFPWYGSASRWE